MTPAPDDNTRFGEREPHAIAPPVNHVLAGYSSIIWKKLGPLHDIQDSASIGISRHLRHGFIRQPPGIGGRLPDEALQSETPRRCGNVEQPQKDRTIHRDQQSGMFERLPRRAQITAKPGEKVQAKDQAHSDFRE